MHLNLKALALLCMYKKLRETPFYVSRVSYQFFQRDSGNFFFIISISKGISISKSIISFLSERLEEIKKN